MNSRALRIVIADDELPLREELRLLPWADYHASLVGEASNGQEALELCSSQQPDVLITDITMPVMDGITLVRELKVYSPQTQIILLTCHSDFHYVQDALRLGALAYILKVSLDDGELCEALDKAREAITAATLTRRSIRSEQSSRLAALLTRLLQGEPLDHTDWQAFPLEAGPYRVVQLCLLTEEAPALTVRESLEQWLVQDEHPPRGSTAWAAVSETEIYGVIHEEASPDLWLEDTLPDIVAKLRHQLQLRHPADSGFPAICAVVSEPLASPGMLTAALEVCKQWRLALFYDGADEQTVHRGSPRPLQPLSEPLARELQELLRTAGPTPDHRCACLSGEFQRRCDEARPEPSQLKQQLVMWHMDWLRQQEASAESIDSLSLTALMDAKTLVQLIRLLIQSILRADQARQRCRLEVREAMAYIREQLHEPLTLPSIAAHVGLSTHHLSRLFREETGSTVGETLTRLRMEKAAELLTQTNLKVYEVADRVGIPSYRYFTQLFRKWTGVPPTDYKRHS
ncbi:response regulator [Paenibacillus daejeonensis]|uniref:response regulator n=1 Tax=Paenibacillus daejeonensis TaxID=135193 RepID=UPI00036D99A2|nr:response regulator [Paenibacillus daejeonensis]